MTYSVHEFPMRMTSDKQRLENFLNSLTGEIVAIIPNVTPFPATFVNFLLIVEMLPQKPVQKEPKIDQIYA